MLPGVKDRSRYEALFKPAVQGQAIGEASASYLWSKEAVQRIHDAVPDARIIALLRDPVDRAHSHYLMFVRDGREQLDFYAALMADRRLATLQWGKARLYEDIGFYGRQLRRYFDAFGSRRVLPVLSRDFALNPTATLHTICAFLDISPDPLTDRPLSTDGNEYGMPKGRLGQWVTSSRTIRFASRRLVPTSVRRRLFRSTILRSGARPSIPEEATALLAAAYQSDVHDVESLLGRSLPQLRMTWPGG